MRNVINFGWFVDLQQFHKQVEAFNVGEPLQVIAYSWNMAFVGSKNGNITVLHRSAEVCTEYNLLV